MYHTTVGRLCVVLLVLAASVSPVGAVVPVNAPTLPQRVALADLVVVGKVTALDKELVKASPVLEIPGAEQQLPYRVAHLAVSSMLVGPRELTKVQVAFIPPGENLPRGVRKLVQLQLAADQEGCFFLRKHPRESFYVAQVAYDVLDRSKAKDFDKEVALVKRCVRLLDDPGAGLKAPAADDRLLTAAMLIFRYRTPQHVYTGKPKTEPIEAEQSKLILKVLAEGDWTVQEGPAPLLPLSLFLRLGLTEEDDWEQPAALKDLAGAAQKWLRDQGKAYRIQRYVPEDRRK
jgi:hypothetical protein